MLSAKKKQYVSIIKQEKQLKLNYQILQDNKILKEEHSTFVATESNMPKDALIRLDVLQKDIPHTYLISVLNNSGQKIIHSSDIDVISYESIPLDHSYSIVIPKNELSMHNRYFIDSGIDYVLSPLSVLYSYGKEFGGVNSLNTLVFDNVLYMIFMDSDQKLAYSKVKALTPFEKIKQEQFTGDDLVDQKLYDEVIFLEIQQFLNDAIEEYYSHKEDVEFLQSINFLYTVSPLHKEQIESLHEALMVPIDYQSLDFQGYINKAIQKNLLENLSFIKPRIKSTQKSMTGWIFLTAVSLIAVILVVYFKSQNSLLEESAAQKQNGQNIQSQAVEVREDLDKIEKSVPLTLPNHSIINNTTIERVKMHFDLIPYDGMLKDLEIVEDGSTYVTYFAIPTTSVEDLQTKLLNIYHDSKVILRHQNEALLNVILENNGLVIEIKSIPYARYNKEEYLPLGKATDYLSKLLPLQSVLKFVKKEQSEALFYQFSATSIIKTPKEFFDFVTSLNNEVYSITLDYPIVFSKRNDGIEIKYNLNLYQAIPEAPKPKS